MRQLLFLEMTDLQMRPLDRQNSLQHINTSKRPKARASLFPVDLRVPDDVTGSTRTRCSCCLWPLPVTCTVPWSTRSCSGSKRRAACCSWSSTAGSSGRPSSVRGRRRLPPSSPDSGQSRTPPEGPTDLRTPGAHRRGRHRERGLDENQVGHEENPEQAARLALIYYNRWP